MNLDETPEEATFRGELRDWLDRNIPDRLRAASAFADRLEADRILASGSYLGLSWPTEFGGGGASPVTSLIVDEQRALAGIPASKSPSRFGINLLGPTLMAHGTPEQQAAFLPPILRAEVVWCQGFSEPDAGSDLANVRCTATLEGNHLVVNGSKVWTTQAQESDWCFALVLTDPAGPRHRNLSFVLIDMRQAGVDVQPLVQSTGEAEFSQVFFDDARVELEHVVGALGDGWAVARTTLGAERSYGQLSRFINYQGQLARIRTMIDKAGSAATDSWRTRFGLIRADLTGIRNLSYKIASVATAEEDLGALASVAKYWWSTTHQHLAELGYEVSVATGIDNDFWFALFLETRAETIYAGSTQIQRNIISERLLGLPR